MQNDSRTDKVGPALAMCIVAVAEAAGRDEDLPAAFCCGLVDMRSHQVGNSGGTRLLLLRLLFRLLGCSLSFSGSGLVGLAGGRQDCDKQRNASAGATMQHFISPFCSRLQIL